MQKTSSYQQPFFKQIRVSREGVKWKQERLDENQYQFNILVPIHAMDESLGSVNGRVRKLVGLVPVPVQVLVEMSLNFIFFVRTKKGLCLSLTTSKYFIPSLTFERNIPKVDH
jgi:hypothetical protein